jgi:prenyltransferase beta subunit
MVISLIRTGEQQHLKAAMAWLSRAQLSNGGFSASYSWWSGWASPYPETTGYIIQTLLQYAHLDNSHNWNEMAAKAGEWLLSIQLSDGGFPGGDRTLKRPIVFNTGMILFGLAALHKSMMDDRFKLSGLRALEWLAKNQNSDGSWTRFSSGGIPHAYHSYVAWGILMMSSTIGRLQEYMQMIEQANNWVISQQDESGWFRHNDLIKGLPPLTHNIAYVVHGLLECGAQLNQNDWLASAEKASQAVYDDWVKFGQLPAGYGPGWQRGPKFRCVTGDAQFGIIWYRLWQITGKRYWLVAAKGIADQVGDTQSLKHILPGVRGGIPGADPVWGGYLRFQYPNWAAKFFSDLLLNLLEI